jgi:hypothetical protein
MPKFPNILAITKDMNRYLKKILVASALLGVVLTIIFMLIQGRYRYALALFIFSCAILFVAGAYGVPVGRPVRRFLTQMTLHTVFLHNI